MYYNRNACVRLKKMSAIVLTLEEQELIFKRQEECGKELNQTIPLPGRNT